MKGIRITATAAGPTAPVGLDTYQTPFSVGIGAVVSGILTFSVEYTFADVLGSNGPAVTNPTWFPLTALAAKTASTDGVLNTPVTAVRVNVTAFTSGSVVVDFVQAGRPGY